jgi:hypothetical protein
MRSKWIQSAIALSESQEMKKGENEVTLPLSNIESIILVLDSIMAKGGHSPRDVLKTTVGKGEAIFGWAISAATEFGLIDYEQKEYSLTELGNKFSSENESGRKQMMRDLVLNYPPYHTILLRLRNAPDNHLSKSDITKAWYDLTKKGNERTREDNTGSFASICQWCGLVESRKKTVILTEEGKASISRVPTPEVRITQTSQVITEREKRSAEKGHANITPNAAQAQLNTTITINIAVDTKEQTSVDNLLKIIKALKGENITQTT